jgi:hypothetical protein
MQFIVNGPDIPDELLQEHEEGRVVFFCGAGISYPAGLPGFKGLVEDVYRRVGATRNSIEDEAFSRNQFDATIDLLERRLPGQRIAVRLAIAEALVPKLRRIGATDTHVALLQLANSREGAIRLVTTNFDRVFEKVAKKTKQKINTYSAPMLPIPKSSRWNGLVYLHGLLPEKLDDSSLHRLVLTSGDFGMAYLTERWAARFVSELFRNYIVCFVGYSINDPVLRYMMDALAADRMMGEVTPQAYALGECEPGQEQSRTIEWQAKGVKPILYEVPSGSQDHSALHKTLKVWAETYRDGVLGKERIVINHALAHPSASSQQDNFVGRMLWALSHESGLPARLFADFNPVPALAWLNVFSENRYKQCDLARFNVVQQETWSENKKLDFSLINRPAPYTLASWMSFMTDGGGSRWDDVMHHLARWLLRHLNDPALLFWFTEQNGRLHTNLQWMIERELDRFAALEREGKIADLEEIRSNAPNAIPNPQMQMLWRLLIAGRVKLMQPDLDFFRWETQFNRDGLTTALRLELRSLLAPMVMLRKPFIWGDDANVADRKKTLIDSELVLAANYVRSSLPDGSAQNWQDALPVLMDELQQLLRDALDLLHDLGQSDKNSDRSHWDLPSISPHWQNRGLHEWIVLIELLRDSWLATYNKDVKRASEIAKSWFDLPYSTFKRLALFAASQEGCIIANEWVNWLVADNAWCLWSVVTQRETMRLIVLQGVKITGVARSTLETAILYGPPRSMFLDTIEADEWQYLSDHSIWLLLAKLMEGNSQLGPLTLRKFDELSAAYPQWKLRADDRDEFSHWSTGTGDPDYEYERQIDIVPRKRRDIVKWLKLHPVPERGSYEDTWRESCRTRFFHSCFALWDLSQEGLWPEGRWKEALQAWSADFDVQKSWQFVAVLVQTMPDDVIQNIAHALTRWMEVVSKFIESHEAIFLNLSLRILMLTHSDGVISEDPVTRAINHPIGRVTQALLNLWFKSKPSDSDGLPKNIEPYFTKLCDLQIEQFCHGRILLASRLIALFRVDKHWTECCLLPLFNWSSNPAEARALWEGFLWSPRLYQPLLIAFKIQLLETARHYDELGEHKQQYAAFLTYAALDPAEGYTFQDFQTAFGVLPKEGLQDAARALWQALEGANENREDYWRNRIQPFWLNVWPKSLHLVSKNIAESLARMSIAARGEFPSALSAVLDWLQPIAHPNYIVKLLHQSGLTERFPKDSLRLLDAIFNDQPWAPKDLRLCLDNIAGNMPSLTQDRRYQKLLQYSRKRGDS